MRKLSIKCMTSITMMKLKKKNIFIILMSVFILMTATPDILVPAASAGIRLWGLKVVPGLIMGLIFVGCLIICRSLLPMEHSLLYCAVFYAAFRQEL